MFLWKVNDEHFKKIDFLHKSSPKKIICFEKQRWEKNYFQNRISNEITLRIIVPEFPSGELSPYTFLRKDLFLQTFPPEESLPHNCKKFKRIT